jgi:two-component system, LytTR family, response regulator
MKIRCIAIDDEPLALELLEDNIRQLPFLELHAGFNNSMEALQYLQQHDIDLVFLDIQMPGLTGLQFIQSLTRRPMFILVTAYERFALEGYSLDVVDYLLKPVSMDRFVKACNKAMELHLLKKAGAQGVIAGAVTEHPYFFVPSDYKMVKVEWADVLYIEGLKDYLKIHLRGQKSPLVTRMSMKSMEEQFPPADFLRIHKSYIVSKKAITAVKKSSVFIDSLELPVGDLYKQDLTSFIRTDLS